MSLYNQSETSMLKEACAPIFIEGLFTKYNSHSMDSVYMSVHGK